MEPFEVLREIIREGHFDPVGGAPQVAKVYRHMNSMLFAVEWEGVPSVVGRPILGYERAFLPVIDPDQPAAAPRSRAWTEPELGEAELAEDEAMSSD
jgi:hypothetical protein